MNRMYQVIVIGGVGLVGPVCGGTVEIASTGDATSGGQGGSAHASSSTYGTGGFPDETGQMGGFPSEGPPPLASSSTGGQGGFPTEGPVFPDAGADGCFPPDETDMSGSGCPDGSTGLPDASDAGFPQEA